MAQDSSETINVTIMYRSSFDGGDGWTYGPRCIAISAFCSTCGEQRGERRDYSFCEDGEWFAVDRWDNPCGHLDTYGGVWNEAKQMQKRVIR